jgi:hypothetical protein
VRTRQNNFDATLTEAVADITANGFDSENRLRMWLDRLRFAARVSLVSEQEAIARVTAALTAAFARGVDRGGILRSHPDLPRFTFDRLKWKLRDELRRRTIVAANLIRVNREEAIERTLHRFMAWTSSVPPGGSEAVDRREVKVDIRKGLSQLSYMERRVAIDQGFKFVANLNDIVARDGGAIAARWSSRWRVPNYHYRPEHKERDGKFYLIKDNWAHRSGLVKPIPGVGYYDDITKPGEEILCQCSAVYEYSLRKLPPEMLTSRGRSELARIAGVMAA